jgi:hypothetical protein
VRNGNRKILCNQSFQQIESVFCLLQVPKWISITNSDLFDWHNQSSKFDIWLQNTWKKSSRRLGPRGSGAFLQWVEKKKIIWMITIWNQSVEEKQ